MIIRRGKLVAVGLVTLVALLVSAGAAQAAMSPDPHAPTYPAVIAQQNAREDESNLKFIMAAFAVVWAAFFGYAFVSARRELQLRREIEALREALKEHEAAQGKSTGSG
ncbi:MAG: CcmD family protein [Chloroflexi bacterium]|nr:CcmD family protein [Chloroflexota bacterium]